MRCIYVLDEGLPCPCQTGVGLDTVASLQNAVKILCKTKEVIACKKENIQIFLPGTTVHNFREKTPLNPNDKLPKGSTNKDYIFVHAHRDYQDLTPEERKLYAKPPEPTPKKPMAKPKPKGPSKEELAAAAAAKLAEEEREKAKAARKAEEERLKAEAARKAEADRKAREKARLNAEAEAAAKKALQEEEEARRKAKEEADRAARKAKAAKEKAEADAKGWEVDRVNHEFTPTPMDMSTQKCWYQLEGDIVPYYIRIQGKERTEELKQHILATRRSGRNAALLEGIVDLADLKLIPPGEDPSTGRELGPGEPLPRGTSMEDPILIIVKEAKGVGRKLTPL